MQTDPRGADGPRERLRRVGAQHLSDEELIALLLGTGRRGESVSLLAARLLTEAGGVARLVRLGPGALAQIAGIGASKAGRIVAALELGRRAHEAPWSPGPRIESSHDVDALVGPRLAHADVEHFVALALDAKNRVTAELRIAIGGTAACPVAPADVFRALLREAAAAVVFVHNHPSGDPHPSADDVQLTARLVQAGTLLGIRVLDHVIIGRSGHFSLAQAGLLGPDAGPDHRSSREAGRRGSGLPRRATEP